MNADFLKELEIQRGYLMRVARLQLRDTALAEDVVQDTLAAALTAQAGFTGKSSVKTWLTGILKHKIVDAIRRKQREPVAASALDEEADLEDFEGLFKENGAWQTPPADWGDPEQALSRQAVLRHHGVLPREAAAQHRPGVHDAGGDGARERRDL